MRLFNFLVLAAFLLPATSFAQVAISLEVQEVYDDNVFLEDDIGALSPEVEAFIAELTPEQQETFRILDSQNGETDDDFITNITFGLNTSQDLADYAELDIDFSGGAVLFGEFSDENRFVINSLARLEAKEEFLPQPYRLFLSSGFRSGGNSIAVAEGSLARQTVTHTATLGLGFNTDVAQQTELDLGYSFDRVDSLGELRINDEDEEELPDILDIDETGSDYFSHNIRAKLTRELSARTKLGLVSGLRRLEFTNIEQTLGEDQDEDSQDRIEYFFGIEGDYKATESLTLRAAVGADFSVFDEDRRPRQITIVGLDGEIDVVTEFVDDEESSLFFNLEFDYSPEYSGYFARAGVRQANLIDINGDRTLTRTVGGDFGIEVFGSSLLSLGADYIQFDEGDSLSDSRDRFTGTASLTVPLSDNISLNGGYSFVNQDVDQEIDDGFLFRSSSFESNRVFLGLSGGFVGLPL